MRIIILTFNIFIGASTLFLGLGSFNVFQHFLSEDEVALPDSIEVPVKTDADNTDEDMSDEAKREPTDTYTPDKDILLSLDIEGFYEMEGDLPEQFEDFRSMEIWLTTYDEKLGEIVSTPPKGYFETNRTFEFNKVYFGKRRLEFSTVEIRGTSFGFRGEYRTEMTSKIPKKEPWVLRGILIKSKNGKEIARSNVKFDWYLGC